MKITEKTGSEGPRHDPYAYSELTVEHNGHTYMLHRGLGDYLEFDEVTICSTSLAEAMFEGLVGWKPSDLLKWHQEAQSRCRTCGLKACKAESGYPGETVYLCKNNHIVSCDMDMSAIE